MFKKSVCWFVLCSITCMLNSVMLNYLHVEFKYVEKCAGRTLCAGRTKPLLYFLLINGMQLADVIINKQAINVLSLLLSIWWLLKSIYLDIVSLISILVLVQSNAKVRSWPAPRHNWQKYWKKICYDFEK